LSKFSTARVLRGKPACRAQETSASKIECFMISILNTIIPSKVNGSEIGKEDQFLEKKIKMDVYRAFPYHSWERGCNENFNGLVREFFPKKMKFATIAQEDVLKVQKLLNNRPRKRLNYYTPREVFFGKIS